jgi:hypothetical protein
MTITTDELLPCPHDGGRAFEYAMDGGFVVECETCACRTSICEYRQVAQETWNTRAAIAAMPQSSRVEELE